jgi:hypothetical protein
MPWRDNIDVDQIADHIEDESMIVGTEVFEDEDIDEEVEDDVEELNFDGQDAVIFDDQDDY